jgi:hypothetical protein
MFRKAAVPSKFWAATETYVVLQKSSDFPAGLLAVSPWG